MARRNAPATVGEALVRLLEAYDVDTVFGIPGVHTVELYRGLSRSPIRHVLTRHEQGAGFMADGYARVTGRPGVCFVISGPGVTNVLTPMGQAYSDSVPMLVVASVIASRHIGQGNGRLHEMVDQRAAAETVAAFSATASAPEAVPELVARAFSTFAAARPRPVHLEVPIDVLSAPAAEGWRPRKPPAPPEPDPGAVFDAVRLLARAERPVMIVGGGAVRAGARLARLAERLSCAVVPTVAGKGVVPDDHPLSLGAVLPQAIAQDFVAAADVVLAVGTELAQTDFWRDDFALPGELIRVDIDPAKLADDHPAAIALLADADKAAAALFKCLEQTATAARSRITAAEVTALRGRIVEAETPLRRSHRQVLEALRAGLPADAIVTSDMAQVAYSGNEIFPVTRPRRWLHPVGFGTLGYAVPAAIGAKIGSPDTPVAALVGDFGFLFTAQELATAAELELPVIVVLWNNEGLGEIEDNMARHGIPPTAVRQANPDFQGLARAYGCRATRPASLAAFSEALAQARAAAGPSVIEIRPDAL